MKAEDITRTDQLLPIDPHQPDKVEFHLADDIFVKMIALPSVGYICKGHSHVFDHTSFLATGKMRIWKEGTPTDYIAPAGIFIEKGIEHMMLALEDNTTFFCIHNTHGWPTDEVVENLVKK